MTRITFGMMFAVCIAASAQTPVVLKAPGSGFMQLQFQNSSIANWAGQMATETAQLNGLLMAAPVPIPVRQQLRLAGDAAVRESAECHRLAVANTRRDLLYQSHQRSDIAVSNLIALIQRSGIVSRDVAQAVSRVQFADVQLEQAFANMQPNDDARWRRQMARLANILSDQAAELRVLADESLSNYDLGLDRAIRGYSLSCQTLENNIAIGVPRDKLNVDVTELDRRWQVVTTGLAASRTANPNVRAAAIRVDTLHRQLVAFVRGTAVGNPGLPGWGVIPRGSAIAIGAGEGGGPRVKIFFDLTGRQSTDFFAYDPNFRGGVRVAMADINGDRVPDLITAPGPGFPPVIRVFDGRTLNLLMEFLAFDQRMTVGVHIAAADLTPQGRALIACAVDVGGLPDVRVFDLSTGEAIDNFQPYSRNFRGGVRLAMGDVNGDGFPDLITAPGPTQPGSEAIGPVVRVFDGRNRRVLTEFNAYDPRWQNGVWVATGDITRNGRSEIFTGADAGGGPHVRVFDGANGQPLSELFPFPQAFNGGVRVAAQDVNGDGVIDFLCGPGPSAAAIAPPVRIFDGRNRRPIGEIRAFEPTFRGGVTLGAH